MFADVPKKARRSLRAALRESFTPFARHLAWFLLGVGIYVQSASHFSFTGTGTILRLEVPLLIYFYGLSYLLLGRCADRPRKRALLAALPMAALYFSYDAYYMLMGKVPLLAEVSEVPELMAVLKPGTLFAAGVVVMVACGYYFLHIRMSGSVVLAVLPLAGVVLLTLNFPAAITGAVSVAGEPVVEHSMARNVARNGRVVMSLYYEARRRVNKEKLLAYADMGQEPVLLPAAATSFRKRDVFVVVLESFIDPNLFHSLKGGPFGDRKFLREYAPYQGFSISPVFGGSTSQAEFEALCGVPAFRYIDSVEFNAFTGAPAKCLPQALRALGYDTIATNAYRPDFFNSYNAYQGLGFAGLNFPREYMYGRDTYLSVGHPLDDYYFDGDLYRQNLDHLKQKKQQSNRPIFSYVLGIYGHYPFRMEPERHPVVYSLDGEPAELRQVVNQYRYRTEALVTYLEGLQKLSPDALIVVISDHLPTFGRGKSEYTELGYPPGESSVFLNRILVLDHGRPVRFDKTIYHFGVPRLILNRLTDGAYCRQADCAYAFPQRLERYEKAYYAVMAEAAANPPSVALVKGGIGSTSGSTPRPLF